MSVTKCCMHLSKVPNSLPVRAFTETTLAKCHAVRNHGRFHNFEHKNVILPDRASTADGYHVSCYRSFIAIVMEKDDKEASDAEGKNLAELNELFIPSCYFCCLCYVNNAELKIYWKKRSETFDASPFTN